MSCTFLCELVVVLCSSLSILSPGHIGEGGGLQFLWGLLFFSFYLMYNFVSIGDRSQHDIPDSRLQRQDRHGSYSSLSSRGRHSPDASLHSRNSPVPSLPRPRRHDHPDRERRERRDLKKVHQCCCLILRTLY